MFGRKNRAGYGFLRDILPIALDIVCFVCIFPTSLVVLRHWKFGVPAKLFSSRNDLRGGGHLHVRERVVFLVGKIGQDMVF
jgi:hypothetical protein